MSAQQNQQLLLSNLRVLGVLGIERRVSWVLSMCSIKKLHCSPIPELLCGLPCPKITS